MIKCNLSKAVISRSKAYYFVIKDMFVIFPAGPKNTSVFISCKQGTIKRETALNWV